MRNGLVEELARITKLTVHFISTSTTEKKSTPRFYVRIRHVFRLSTGWWTVLIEPLIFGLIMGCNINI